MKRGALLFSVIGLALLLFVSNSHGAASKQLWTFGTTSKASGFYASLVYYSSLINKYVPEVSCTPIETGATVDNWRRMDKGEVQLGFGAAGADWQGYQGEGPFQGKPIKKGRVFWIDGFSTYNWVVRADSGMKVVPDLNGKKVNISIAGSIAEELALWSFKLLGIQPKDILKGSTADAIEQMQNRRIDAWWKGSVHPDSAIVSLSATTPVSMLNFSDAELAKLHADRLYMSGYTIPANTYKGVSQYRTPGSYVSVIVTADIAQELQYKVIKAVYEHWEEFLAAFPGYKIFSDPLKLTAEGAIIPLSAGTVQYLQEKGYTVPQKYIPPEYKKK